jgi:hypothetical protein
VTCRQNGGGDILDTASSVKQAVFRMQMKMNKISHYRTLLKN